MMRCVFPRAISDSSANCSFASGLGTDTCVDCCASSSLTVFPGVSDQPTWTQVCEVLPGGGDGFDACVVSSIFTVLQISSREDLTRLTQDEIYNAANAIPIQYLESVAGGLVYNNESIVVFSNKKSSKNKSL